MNIDITRLKSGIDEYALIDLDYSFSQEQLKNTGILKLDHVKIEGNITNHFRQLHLNVVIKGIMILPCSISLKPTEYPFTIKIDDDIIEKELENTRNSGNSIDIFPIIWENIVMEIPLKVVNNDLSDIKKEGNGWKFITDEEEL